MLQRKLAGLSMSLFITLFCCFILVYGNISGKKYDEGEGSAYLKKINAEIQIKTTESVLASWAYESNITDENLRHQLDVSAKLANYTKEIWKETIKYPWKTFKNPDVRRQFQKFSVLGTAILSPSKYERFNKIISDMQSIYGKAKICNYHNRTNCSLQLEPELTEIFVKSRDPDELRYYWEQWRNVAGRPVRKMYKEYVDLSNEAAVLNNFTDNAEFWLKDYEAKDFKQQVEALWEHLRPLYLQLHAYVRRRLREQYGEKHVTKRGPIPAHLLGNMWAQSWGNIFDFTAPYPGKPSMDVTPNMVEQEYTPLKMFKLAEGFFTSLNLSPMPDTFWKNSILEKPKDGRDLICHASAWDFYDGKDFRIKQCTRVTFRQLVTVHHEMGHIQYYLQYKNQPKIYRRGANPGFHEAVGDVMALSVSTPKHLRKIGLLNATQDDSESEINQLFSMALDKIAFLPFGYLMDQWRWSVFEGKTTERDYNCKWWQLREKYQGLSPSVIRTENDFDPGAKYHTVGNVPYIRYFVSFVIQFQFHRSLCIAAKEFDPNDPISKPLHKCDIYQSKEAGALLKKMLKMGSSKPWPDAMEVMTGQRKMDARALLDYFATLQAWLEKENKRTGEFIGWESSSKECNWEERDERKSAKALTAQGNFEDDNIAYSYAEFVRQDDNSFGFPDYLEEIQPSYHGFRHRLKKKEFQANYFLPKKKVRKLTVANNLCLTAGPYLQDENKFIEVPRPKPMNSILEREAVKPKNEQFSSDGSHKILKLPINDALEKRKKRRNSEKTKLMNEILQEIQSIKDSEVTVSSSLADKKANKNIQIRNVSGDKKNSEKISENQKGGLENLKQESKFRNEKLKLENKEESKAQKFSNQKSGNSVLDDSDNSVEYKVEAYTEKLNSEKAGCHLKSEKKSDLKHLEKQSELKHSEKQSEVDNSECKLDGKSSGKKLELQNSESRARNELLWKAELVKNEAERMLQSYNLSNYTPNSQNFESLSKSTSQSPTQETSPETEAPPAHTNNKKTRNILPLYNSLENSKHRKNENFKFNPYENFLKNEEVDSLKSNVQNKKHFHFKEYDLVGVVPIDCQLVEDKNEMKSVNQKRSAEKSGKSDVTYVLLVGKISDKETPNLGLNRRKKSYKEYHYNVKTPVVYNAVVITPGGKPEKPDETKDHWVKISKRMARFLESESNTRDSESKLKQRSHEFLLNRISSSVTNNKYNISNIVQYFGCLQILL